MVASKLVHTGIHLLGPPSIGERQCLDRATPSELYALPALPDQGIVPAAIRGDELIAR